jgi:DNA-binding NarL/FixJ family response regulator
VTADKLQPCAIVVASHNQRLISHVIAALKCGGLLAVAVQPTAEAILRSAGESQACVVLLDALHNGSEVLALAKVLAESRPLAKVAVLGGKADLALVARAIVAKASHFLLESTPSDDFAKAIADLIANKPPSSECFFGRVWAELPVPTGKEDSYRTPSGRRLSTEDAIKQCDQFGIGVDEIAEYLRAPVAHVERVTKKARTAQKPSVVSEVLVAVTPQQGVRLPSMRAVGGVLAGVVAVLAVVQFLSRGPSDQHGFSYLRVRGTILYEDGAPIPVKGLALLFLGEGEGKGARAASALGLAVVDEQTGAFDCVLRVLPAQAGRNVKVALGLNSGGAMPSDMVPAIYADPKSTPLEVSPQGATVTLRVKKPLS